MPSARLLRLPVLALLCAAALLPLWGCAGGSGEGVATVVGPDQDIGLGLQVAQQIESDPNTEVLDTAQYTKAYATVNGIVSTILASGKVAHKDDFPWRVRILKDDSTLNAFCAPGGFIYVYTGILKYLRREDDLAGVLGHEIAHADHRHAVQQMVKTFGLQALLGIVAGDQANGVLAQVTEQLVSLRFSRGNERDADETSVSYLCGTRYKSNGAASFFRQLLKNERAGGAPQFLSTHPSPENRVPDIDNQAAQLGCDTTSHTERANWVAFQKSLP